jgi:hypothetical protein
MPSSPHRRCQARTVSSSNNRTFHGLAAAHPFIQRHQRARAPGQSVSHGTIATQVNHVAKRFGVKEAGADHTRTRIEPEPIRKRGAFRVPPEPRLSLGGPTRLHPFSASRYRDPNMGRHDFISFCSQIYSLMESRRSTFPRGEVN